MKEEVDVNIDVEAIKQKANYFYKNSIPIHAKYKRGHWKRGYILSFSSDFFMLNEFHDGEMPIFFLELLDIEKYNEVKDEKEI